MTESSTDRPSLASPERGERSSMMETRFERG